MNKYKFILKGKGEQFSTKANGDFGYIVSCLMQYVCELSIESNITKKEFLEKCKNSYESSLKAMNEMESE